MELEGWRSPIQLLRGDKALYGAKALYGVKSLEILLFVNTLMIHINNTVITYIHRYMQHLQFITDYYSYNTMIMFNYMTSHIFNYHHVYNF